MHQHQLPEIGFLRAADIIGDRKKGIPAILPISRSTFWARVKSGEYPKGVLLSENIRAWPVSEVRQMVADLEAGAR